MIPTKLYIGDEYQLNLTIIKKLQQVFCKQKPPTDGCFCPECKNIKQAQHRSIIWIEPKKNYVLQDIAIIFEKIKFSLDDDQQLFFILKKAHLLSPVCANKLLKTLEEPPEGYNFFLLANNEQTILPTIRSRCSIHHVQSKPSSLMIHPLISFFIDPTKPGDPFTFDQELRKQKISEEETVSLLYELTNSIQKRIVEQQKKCITIEELERLAHTPSHAQLKKTLEFLQDNLQKPPQAGSASLFWKKLFLTFPRNINR